MARNKTYNTKEIISLLNEYRIENPEIKISIPKFGAYIREKGYDIKDHTLRRDDELRKYLEEFNQDNDSKVLNDLVTYKTIDADLFIEKNCNKTKLKDALTNRDRYYADVAAKAVEAIKEKNSVLEKNKKLEEKITELETKIKELNQKLENKEVKVKENTIKEKNKTIIALKNILEDYIYPDVANAILKKEGILEVVNNIVTDDVVEQKSIYADTDVTKMFENGNEKGKKDEKDEKESEKKKSKYASVNSILGDFDE